MTVCKLEIKDSDEIYDDVEDGEKKWVSVESLQPILQELIEILALPNMGNEGRKRKLIAIKAWQIRFLGLLEQKEVSK